MSFLQSTVFSAHSFPIGLDISDLSVKLAWLDRRRTIDRVRSFGSVPLPAGAIVDGEIKEEDKVIEAIRKVVASSGPDKVTTRQVFCSLPETKVFLRVITLPRLGEDELAEAIKWEIEGNIPLSLDQIYYDYQILNEELTFLSDEKHQAILVVAVARRIADQYVRVVEQAGLEVVGLETESLAQARIFAPPETTPPTTTLIVDLGDRRTSFSVAVGNVPLFTSSTHLSAQLLTDTLAKSLRIPFAEAEKIKQQYGIGDGPQQYGSSKSALQEVLNDLLREIERASNFYTDSLGYTRSVDRVLLCGGGANLLGLVPYLARQLHQPIEKGDPWKWFRFGKKVLPPIAAEDASRFSTALGLSLGGSFSSVYALTN